VAVDAEDRSLKNVDSLGGGDLTLEDFYFPETALFNWGKWGLLLKLTNVQKRNVHPTSSVHQIFRHDSDTSADTEIVFMRAPISSSALVNSSKTHIPPSRHMTIADRTGLIEKQPSLVAILSYKSPIEDFLSI
jgi:hypothetical protein